MTKVEQLEQAVQELTSEEFSSFRAWFAEFDWAIWDHQIEEDVKAGRLDQFADEALEEQR